VGVHFIVVLLVVGALRFAACGASHPAGSRALLDAFARCSLIIMVDEDNPCMFVRAKPNVRGRPSIAHGVQRFGADLKSHFMGISPSVELMHSGPSQSDRVYQPQDGAQFSVIDPLTNYKF